MKKEEKIKNNYLNVVASEAKKGKKIKIHKVY